jgi:hypothetical protein
MTQDGGLRTFWITFPKATGCTFPIGFGVTAWSEADAFRLLEQQGYDQHRRAEEIVVTADVNVTDLDPRNVVPVMGPIVVRGIWYPPMNVGWGAPR